jgi:threonine synthase
MGLPIGKLTIASNRNDILTRFFETGDMKTDKVMPSISPSMDIQVSSNFERYLFDLLHRDAPNLNHLMRDFVTTKSFHIGHEVMKQARSEFSADRCSDAETLAMMRECYDATGILIDPHTAVGLHAATRTQEDPTMPSVVLACAHPAKFPDAVEQATGIRPALPPHLADLMERNERFTILPNDLAKVTDFVRANAAKG